MKAKPLCFPPSPYGSWTSCRYCGSYFFDDAYFRNHVYRNVLTSTEPDLLAAHRREVPTDPLEHCHGEVGVSSRWWYLARMYKISGWCGHCTKVSAKDRNKNPGVFLDKQMQRS